MSGNRPDPDRRDDERGWGRIDPYGAVTVSLANGLRGPDDAMYEPYLPESGGAADAEQVSTHATPDDDGPVIAAIATIGTISTVIALALVSSRVARDGRRSAHRGERR